jgi:phosphoglycolate phosphatase
VLDRLRALVAPESLDLVIFDLDGTLVDSAADLKLALDRVYDDLGLERASEAQVRTWVGNGAEMLVKRALSYDMAAESCDADLFSTAYRSFLKHYNDTNGQVSVCYEGALDLLSSLRQESVAIAIATNKPAQFTRPLLSKLGIDADFVVSGDTVSAKKPDPMQLNHCLGHFSCDARRTVMVGDSSNDILAAQACGIKNVAVSYGYNHGVSISSYRPDLLIDSLSELR